MHIFRPKAAVKFQKHPGKIVGGDDQCLYALVGLHALLETDLSSNCKNVTKFNLRITAKCHVHLQTLTKTPAKFQKDPGKIIGGVALCLNAISPKMTMSELRKK